MSGVQEIIGLLGYSLLAALMMAVMIGLAGIVAIFISSVVRHIRNPDANRQDR